MSWYRFLYKTFRGLMLHVVFPTKIVRRCGEFPEGKLLLCCNHLSAADVILLIAACPRQLRFMAKKELFSVPVLGWLIRTMGAFPVDRAGGNVGALKKGVQLLNEEEVVGIFPQGTRCKGADPRTTVGKLHGGMALMAERTHAPIIPVSIETKGYVIKPFKRNVLSFGAPVAYGEYAPLLEDGGRNALTKEIFLRICDMADESRIERENKKNRKRSKRGKDTV